MDKIKIARQLVRIARQLVADEDDKDQFIKQLSNQERMEYTVNLDAILNSEAKIKEIYKIKTNQVKDYRKELDEFVKSMYESSRSLEQIQGLSQIQKNDIDDFKNAMHDFGNNVTQTTLGECQEALQAFNQDFPTDREMTKWMKQEAEDQYDEQAKRMNDEIEKKFFQYVDKMQKKQGQFSDQDLEDKAKETRRNIQDLMKYLNDKKGLLPKAKEKLQKFSDMANKAIDNAVSSTGLAGFAIVKVKQEIEKAMNDTKREIMK